MSEEKIKDRSTLGKEEFMEKYAIGAILSMSCYRVFLFALWEFFLLWNPRSCSGHL